jgi:hypothetical protein
MTEETEAVLDEEERQVENICALAKRVSERMRFLSKHRLTDEQRATVSAALADAAKAADQLERFLDLRILDSEFLDDTTTEELADGPN